MPHQLFWDISWFDFEQKKQKAIFQRIDVMDVNSLEKMDASIDSIISEFSSEPLAIGEGRFTEIQDADLGTSQLAHPGQWNLPSRPPGSAGKSVTFVIPYTGNRDLLSVRPTQYSSNFPVADVTGTEIHFTYTVSLMHFPDHTALTDKFKMESIRDTAVLQQWITNINQHVESFNKSIRDIATRRIQNRRDKIASDQKLLDDLNN